MLIKTNNTNSYTLLQLDAENTEAQFSKKILTAKDTKYNHFTITYLRNQKGLYT